VTSLARPPWTGFASYLERARSLPLPDRGQTGSRARRSTGPGSGPEDPLPAPR
jgi:hypothetical protein